MNTNKNPGCLTALLSWLGLAPRQKEQEDEAHPALPYHVRDDFLSPTEISFYHVLRTIVGDEATVCPKVSLGDLFYTATGDYGQNRSWMNRIDRKHVDFLVCEPGSMRPTLGVELDDASHERADRQERDLFVDQVFAGAELPLVRVPAQSQYNTDQVRARLRSAIGPVPAGDSSKADPEAAHEGQDAADGPLCPNCGAPMVLREVSREGPRQGTRFWGCPNFPRCRGTRDLEGAA